MSFLNENIGAFCLIVSVIFAIAVGFMIYTIGEIRKSLVTKKFGFSDLLEVSVKDNSSAFSVIISNKSINDITINAIGFMCGLKNFDFIATYRAQNNLSNDAKITVAQRSFIKFTISIKELEEALFKSVPTKRLDSISCYVVDSFGNISKGKTYKIYKTVNAHFKPILAERIKILKEEQAKNKEEAKAEQEKAKEMVNNSGVKKDDFHFKMDEAFEKFKKSTDEKVKNDESSMSKDDSPEEKTTEETFQEKSTEILKDDE